MIFKWESVAVILTTTKKQQQQQQQKSIFLFFGAAEEARGTTGKFFLRYNNALKQLNRFEQTSAHPGRLHS